MKEEFFVGPPGGPSMNLERISGLAGRSLPLRQANKRQLVNALIKNKERLAADHIKHSLHSRIESFPTHFQAPEPQAIVADGLKFWFGIVRVLKQMWRFLRHKLSLKLMIIISAFTLLSPLSPNISAKGSSFGPKHAPTATALAKVGEIDMTINAKEAPIFQWPLGGLTSQEFSSSHPGLDIPKPSGSEILPLSAGVVERAAYDSDGRGLNVVIRHGDGFSSSYFHLGKIYVSVGDQVKENTPIGTVGLTGRTTGAHLHFEMYDGGKQVNPRKYLP